MRVLLADDQIWLRSALRLLLEDQAKLIVVGETGNIQALPTLVTELHPDLLFLDWQMSGLKTNNARLATITSVRISKPDLYIVALTGDDDGTCLQLGANAVINRAEAPDRILVTVWQALAQRIARQNLPLLDYPLPTFGMRKV